MSHHLSRRDLLRSLSCGVGGISLANFLSLDEAHAAVPGHYTDVRTPGKARHVICLWLGGGPSHVDLFDPKAHLVASRRHAHDTIHSAPENPTGDH